MIATANAPRSTDGSSDRAAASTPMSSSPVTAQTISASDGAVAAIRPLQHCCASTGRPSSPSSSSASPSSVKRANTPLASGPSSISASAWTSLTADQLPTTTRITFSVPLAPSEEPVAATPRSRSRSLTVSHASESASSHSTRTGRRLPSIPLRNGSG